ARLAAGDEHRTADLADQLAVRERHGIATVAAPYLRAGGGRNVVERREVEESAGFDQVERIRALGRIIDVLHEERRPVCGRREQRHQPSDGERAPSGTKEASKDV